MTDNNGARTSSDVEDYMSDAYTSVDIRPGIVKTHTQMRHLRMEAKRVENIDRLRNMPTRSEIEQKMRDDALGKPVSENSKGFLLLSKMGYKPGMSLGVEKEGRNEGIKVPIALELKNGRTGLGHDTEEDEKRKRRMDLYQKAVLERAKANDAMIDDFSGRKRRAAHLRQLLKDLGGSRKVCQELDARNGLELPTSSHFWPIYAEKTDEDVLPVKRQRAEEAEHVAEAFTYFNGSPAPDDFNTDELPENEIVGWLSNVTNYLRTTHRYCIWCGTQYGTKEELEINCPGSTREEHEGVDEDN